MNIVVFGPGRTGSILITKQLATLFNLQEVINDILPNCVIHTHNPLFSPTDKTGWIAVVSSRNNVFLAVCSKLILEKTNEFMHYTDVEIEPFIVGKDRFRFEYILHMCFYSLLELSGYSKVVYVEFEKLFESNTYLSKLFGLRTELEISTEKSPHLITLISNLNELLSYWQELQNEDLTKYVGSVKKHILDQFGSSNNYLTIQNK